MKRIGNLTLGFFSVCIALPAAIIFVTTVVTAAAIGEGIEMMEGFCT